VKTRRILSAPRWVAVLLVAGLAFLGGASGWAVEHARGPEWQASTEVLVRFWSVESFLLSGQSSSVSSADVADAATLARSRDVLDGAATRLPDDRTGAELGKDVTVTPSSTSNSITIEATGTDAATARRTSEAVATAMIAALQNRIEASRVGLDDGGSGAFQAELEQRAEVLTRGVRPLIALTTSEPKQIAPASKTIVAFAIVGLAAGTLLVIGLRFARPAVEQVRVAQRMVSRPAVPFGSNGSPEAARLVRRLLDDRPGGTVLVVPVDADAEKPARAFADWVRGRSSDTAEANRVVSSPEPAGAVLSPRPGPADVAAVLLVVPRSTPRQVLTDAVTLLNAWRPADAVVVST
jgi:capsular polysaccharide biosynthesis protein